MKPDEADLAAYQIALIEHLLAGTLADADGNSKHLDDPAFAPFRDALANADPRALLAAQDALSKWVRRA